MYLSGVSFYVLGDHFLIHQSHPYEEEARRSEVLQSAHRHPVALTDIFDGSASTTARFTVTSGRRLA